MTGASKRVLLALGLLAALCGASGIWVGSGYLFNANNQGYAPEQPIPYSHRVHAGENKIACLYCHYSAERSRHATVPTAAVCMNCHNVVKADSQHVQKLQEYFKSRKPIEWVRVHELPDFVYFSHKSHVAASLSCETCHGDVKYMERMYQYAPLTMGWCLDCHRGLTMPKQVQMQMKMRQKFSGLADIDCTACHN